MLLQRMFLLCVLLCYSCISLAWLGGGGNNYSPGNFKTLEIDGITYIGKKKEDIYTTATDLCSTRQDFALLRNDLKITLSRADAGSEGSTSYYIDAKSNNKLLEKDSLGIEICNGNEKSENTTTYMAVKESLCANETVIAGFSVIGGNAENSQHLTDAKIKSCVKITNDAHDSLILQFNEPIYISHVIGINDKESHVEVQIGEYCMDSTIKQTTLNIDDISWTNCERISSPAKADKLFASSCRYIIGSHLKISLDNSDKLCELSVLAVNITRDIEDRYGACNISNNLHSDSTADSSSLQTSMADIPTASLQSYETNIPTTSLQSYENDIPTTSLQSNETDKPTTSLQSYETDIPTTSLQSHETIIPTTSLQSYESFETDIPTTSLQSHEVDIPITSFQRPEIGIPTTSLQGSEGVPNIAYHPNSETDQTATSIQSSETGVSTTSLQSLSSITASTTPAPVAFDHRGRAIRSKCICRCRNSTAAPSNMKSVSKKAEAIKRSLTVNTRDLTKTTQRKISAKDGRTSSQTTGILAAVLLILPVTALIFSDVFHVLYLCCRGGSKKPGDREGKPSIRRRSYSAGPRNNLIENHLCNAEIVPLSMTTLPTLESVFYNRVDSKNLHVCEQRDQHPNRKR